MKEKEIRIVAAEPDHLESLLKIINEGFHQKFGYIIDDREKQLSLVRDFGLINPKVEDREFAALADDRVLGYLSLRYKGQKGPFNSPSLSLCGLLRRYGLKGVIKAFRLGIAFNHHSREGELYIDTIGVSSEARGLGIGSRMLEFAEDLAGKKGLNRLSLIVMFENTRARALYERFGFEVVSEEKLGWLKKNGGYSGAHFMVKKRQHPGQGE